MTHRNLYAPDELGTPLKTFDICNSVFKACTVLLMASAAAWPRKSTSALNKQTPDSKDRVL